MKQTLFAVAVLAIAAAAPAHALITDAIPNTTQATFNIAQVYPCTVASYPAALGIAEQVTFCPGTANVPLAGGGIPGTLCLQRKGNVLDVNCFVVTPSGQFGPCVVQAFRLIKEVPGSFKCPDVFGLPHFDDKGNLIPFRFFQYGSGVRTWWSLNFTQPGTRFILEVVSVCRDTKQPVDDKGNPTGPPGNARVHKDTWIWRVVANVDTLDNLIDVMHGSAVSTLEVPCILGEDMFDALKKAVLRLRKAVDITTDGRLTEIGNSIFDLEALIVANCLFVEVLNPLVAFPGAEQFGAPNIQPPGNLAQTVFFGQAGSAVAGIIDTIENPCCCKLLVDLEWISLRQGLIGQTPTLPTF